MTTRAELSRLSGSGRSLAGAEDFRGRTVFDRSNAPVGRVEDLLVDAAGTARFLLVAPDGQGRGVLLPVETVQASDAAGVYLNQPSEHLESAPAFDEARLGEDRYWHELYDWYGFTPYWAPGYGAG